MRGQGTAVLAAVSLGLALASSCFPLLATTVGALGPWALAAIAGAGGLAWLVSRIYSELSGAWPTSAGVRAWLGTAFGRRLGLAASLLYLFLVVALGASEAWVLSQVLATVLPGAAPLVAILALVGGGALLNVIGVEPTGRVQLVLSFGLVAAIVGLAVASGASSAAHPVTATPITLAALPGAIFLFVGFEWVVSAIESPAAARRIPRATSWALALMGVAYGALALAFHRLVPPAELGRGVTQHLALGAAVGSWGVWAMAAVSIVATVTTFNSGILGASRLVYALARDGVLPAPLATLHPRFLTPWLAILAVAGVTGASACLLAGSAGAAQVPVLVGAAIECATFALVAVAFARLRATHADRARPYRAFFGPRTAYALAVVFALLAVGCVAQGGLVALALLGGAVATTAAWTAVATRPVPVPERSVR